jgi:hypothetical protein
VFRDVADGQAQEEWFQDSDAPFTAFDRGRFEGVLHRPEPASGDLLEGQVAVGCESQAADVGFEVFETALGQFAILGYSTSGEIAVGGEIACDRA